MSKAFTKESDADPDDDDASAGAALPAGLKNYITVDGYARLRAELSDLLDVQRPQVVDAVHWAAKNGDRSENGDYIYGKKRLREIDRRIRFLGKRLEIAAVVDPSIHHGKDQVFFGATVTYATDAPDDAEHRIVIKGVDEADATQGEISWIAPVARALLGASVGDVVKVATPAGVRELELLEVSYPSA
jgi:transcription elongation factor GreB